MKRLLPILGMICTLSSCIYDSPNDRFYRTLWISEESPFNNAEAVATYGLEESGNYLSNGGRLTLEFLCGEGVSVRTTSASRQSAGPSAFGTYSFDGPTAVLNNLKIEYSNGTITFLEAHRNGDTLFLLWRVESMLYLFTTAMRRLSEYED